jgi:predicted small lipoprotein YifL
MRCDACHVALRSRAADFRLWGGSLTRVFGIVTVSIILLCGALGCGHKGPLKPLKKDTPAYNFMQTGLALPAPYMVPE